MDFIQFAPLVVRFQAGDHAAFRELYERTRPYLFGRLLRVVRNDRLCEECLQYAFGRLWEHRATLEPSKAVFWVLTVAVNRSRDLDRLRRRHFAHQYDPEIYEPAAPEPREPFPEEYAARIRRAVDTLPGSLGDLVRDRYWEGLDYQAIVNRRGLRHSTLGSRLRQARRLLVDRLADLAPLAL